MVAVEDMAADVVAADMVVDVAEDMAADVGAEDTAARVDMEEARVDMAAAEVNIILYNYWLIRAFLRLFII